MKHRLSLPCMFAALVVAFAPGNVRAASSTDLKIRITVLSGRPDMVSGGDALVRIDVPAGISLDKIVVKLNDQAATGRT